MNLFGHVHLPDNNNGVLNALMKFSNGNNDVGSGIQSTSSAFSLARTHTIKSWTEFETQYASQRFIALQWNFFTFH